jgi:Spy/CpxP family protein refolding chaperone
MRRERAGLSLDRPLLMSLRSLDLTDQQWQRVQAILEVQQLRGDSANESPQQRQAQMAALLNPGDPQHAAALQAIKQRADARIDQAARTQQALYDVLTPVQKTRFQQLVAQRRERMDQRMQQRGARRDQDNGPGDAPAPSGP